jgi:hypothetical protein
MEATTTATTLTEAGIDYRKLTLSDQRYIGQLRQTVYAYYGNLGGASDLHVAEVGIKWGGKAAEAGNKIISILGRAA